MPVGSADATLQANLNSAESAVEYVSPTATGFQITSTSSEVNASGTFYLYMAIRRGPMRTPTDGTKVYATDTFGGTSPNPPAFNGVLTDLGFYNNTPGSFAWNWGSRLQGKEWLELNKTDRNGRVLRYPVRSDITVPMEEHLIVELYSK